MDRSSNTSQGSASSSPSSTSSSSGSSSSFRLCHLKAQTPSTCCNDPYKGNHNLLYWLHVNFCGFFVFVFVFFIFCRSTSGRGEATTARPSLQEDVYVCWTPALSESHTEQTAEGPRRLYRMAQKNFFSLNGFSEAGTGDSRGSSLAWASQYDIRSAAAFDTWNQTDARMCECQRARTLLWEK